MYALFAAPPDRDLDWQEDGVAGVSRFLARVYRLVMRFAPVAQGRQREAWRCAERRFAELLRKLHQTIAKITLDFAGRWHFNTSIAAIMELVNEIDCGGGALGSGEFRAGGGGAAAVAGAADWRRLRRFWRRSCGRSWAKTASSAHAVAGFDPGLAKEDEIEIPVQVNGKLRAVVRVPADADKGLRLRRWRTKRCRSGWRARRRSRSSSCPASW
jgi:leucyl-tRNA synthetase